MMLSGHHCIMVHSIAQLAFFCNSLLRSRMRFKSRRTYKVRMRIYHSLPCDETDQNDPGVNDMAFRFCQNLIKLVSAISKHFFTKIVKSISKMPSNRNILVVMPLLTVLLIAKAMYI